MCYAFVYTPLKRVSSIAVLVGAFPGAVPPLLGWVAATGEFTFAALVLFLLQFFWQFPHFWSIAWILDDDYKKAGYQLLPSNSGRTKESAMQVIIYSVILIPLSFLPHIFGISGELSMFCVAAGSILFTLFSFKLYQSLSIKDAKRLMFASILYNPLVLISLLIDKL